MLHTPSKLGSLKGGTVIFLICVSLAQNFIALVLIEFTYVQVTLSVLVFAHVTRLHSELPSPPPSS